MKRKRGLVHVILALLMSMLLIVSTGCGKSGSGDSSSDKKTDKTETLADVNAGKIRESTLEKYLYKDESKEEYAKRLKEE